MHRRSEPLYSMNSITGNGSFASSRRRGSTAKQRPPSLDLRGKNVLSISKARSASKEHPGGLETSSYEKTNSTSTLPDLRLPETGGAEATQERPQFRDSETRVSPKPTDRIPTPNSASRFGATLSPMEMSSPANFPLSPGGFSFSPASEDFSAPSETLSPTQYAEVPTLHRTSTTDSFEPRTPDSEGSSWDSDADKAEELAGDLDPVKAENLDLHETLLEKELELRNVKEEAYSEIQRARTGFRQHLQAFNLLPQEGKAPVWKADSDGMQNAPLYEDIPNIYRESSVNLHIHRAAIKKMLEDYDAMVSIATEGITAAEELEFAPLTARCHFIRGVALFHQQRYAEAQEDFRLSYGSDQYGFSEAYINEWLGGCAEASGSPMAWMFTDPGSSKRARRLWGSPEEAIAAEEAKRDRARANTIIRSRIGTMKGRPRYVGRAGLPGRSEALTSVCVRT